MKVQNRYMACICIFTIIFFSFPQNAESEVIFNNGQVNIVDYTINDIVDIRNSPIGTSTTVNLVEGGNILGYRCHVRGKSVMNIYNGSVESYVLAYEDARFTMTSGSIRDFLVGDGYSKLYVSGGFIAAPGEGGLEVSGHSEIIFSGGQVGDFSNASGNDFSVEGFAKGTIKGGIIERLITRGEGQVYIKGGQVGYSSNLISMILQEDSQTTISGGKIVGPIYLGANPNFVENCILTVEGSNFRINGTPVEESYYFKINPEYTIYTISGTLRSGERISNTIRLYDNTVLYIVPEPSTFFLLWPGMLILTRLRTNR